VRSGEWQDRVRGRPAEATPARRRPGRLLDGQVALVVGGSRGIGAAAAGLLARVGAAVVVAARTRTGVSQVCDSLPTDEAHVLAWVVDVQVPDQVDQLVDAVLLRFGRVDHVLYCAGHLPEAAFCWDIDPDDLRRALDVNVVGPALVARRLVPVMLEQGRGNLVFLGSALPDRTIPSLGAYTASRAAQDVLVRALAAELQGSGVTVNLFTPPPTATSALGKFRGELSGRRSTTGRPAGEDAETVARAVVGLCLPGAWPDARPPGASGFDGADRRAWWSGW
jgi:NAD(P)-dependent dehydrogenase (short-subunit alcohol dehydrogenase family)